MKSANLKVKTRLDELGFELEIRILPDAVRTAQAAADALGCAVGQIANSLIFRERNLDQAVLIMCAGDHRVDLHRVEQQTGLILDKADADFVRAQTGFAIGGVPPLAHTISLKTLLDSSLKRFDLVWAAAGTPESVFSMDPDQLQKMTTGTWVECSIAK